MLKVKYFLYCLLIGILSWSVIKFGYFFQFNADEVFNANTIYLMVKGYKPYLDFYTVYSPIVHWILTPVFLLSGFNFEAVSQARILMIVFFLIRLFLMYLLIAKIFGKRVGLIFVPLYLMSPFVVFSEMQIRPDNLMMLFYIIFLLSFFHKRYFLSGVMFSLTFLTNIKILPSLAAFGIVFLLYVFSRKKIPDLMRFINGCCLTFLAFLTYFFVSGYAAEMFQHVFLDGVRLNNSIPHPTWLGYFYFSNPTIYGLDGKPINWMLTWALPVLAFAGGYGIIVQNTKFKIQNENTQQTMSIVLFLSLFLQWLSMLFINSVFIQYYIPLNWLYALFTAYFVNDLLIKLEGQKYLYRGMILLFLIFAFLLYKTSLQANFARSKRITDPIIKEMKELWHLVPEDMQAFPNVVFRRPIYPVLWGSTFAPYMRERYPPVHSALEKQQLQLLTGLNDEYFSFLDNESQQYILNNYQRDPVDQRIWRRK